MPTTPATVIASRTRLDFNLRALHATVVADVQLEVVHVASSESSSDAVGVRFHGPKWRPAIVTVIVEPAPLRGTFSARARHSQPALHSNQPQLDPASSRHTCMRHLRIPSKLNAALCVPTSVATVTYVPSPTR